MSIETLFPDGVTLIGLKRVDVPRRTLLGGKKLGGFDRAGVGAGGGPMARHGGAGRRLPSTGAAMLAFATQTQAELRDHFFPQIAFGDLDCYQCLVVLGKHAARHVLQIEEIKADPAIPAS